MKMERIILHISILALAVFSMTLIGTSIAKNYKYITGYEEKEDNVFEYMENYAQGVDSAFRFIYKKDMAQKVQRGKTPKINEKAFSTEFQYYIVYQKNGKTYIDTNLQDGDEITDVTKFCNIATYDGQQWNFEDTGKKDCYLEYQGDEYFFENLIDVDEKIYDYVSENHMQLTFAVKKNSNGLFADIQKSIDNSFTSDEIKDAKRELFIRFGIALAGVVIALLLYIKLMFMAGHRTKGDQAECVPADKLWIDLGIVFLVGIYIFLLSLGEYELSDLFSFNYLMIMWGILNLFVIEMIVLMSESIVRRIKCGCFISTTLTGTILLKLKKFTFKAIKRLKKIALQFFHHLSLSVKVIFLSGMIVIWGVAIYWCSYNDQDLLFLIILFGPAFLTAAFVWKYFFEIKVITNGMKNIARGNIDYKIEEGMTFHSNQILKEQANNIGRGLKEAVDSSMRNERMKTELITNVSHDLKTPLTSIINYVDLLRTEGLDSERAKDYLKILDDKSQRLKILTEDLVEASKLSSGVTRFEKEKIDIVQLVKQSLGEYNEKFSQKGLEVIRTVKKEPLYIIADGRKTWRALDNLYHNIYKYAMKNTRVYIDIENMNGVAMLSIKNISEVPLNITPEELMERFVRGDASRTTEGSGLGLSIAKTIIERQGGRMEIVLDGDLFKVVILMNMEEKK